MEKVDGQGNVPGFSVFSLDERRRRTEDGIDILPARVFAQRLWKGELIAG